MFVFLFLFFCRASFLIKTSPSMGRIMGHECHMVKLQVSLLGISYSVHGRRNTSTPHAVPDKSYKTKVMIPCVIKKHRWIPDHMCVHSESSWKFISANKIAGTSLVWHLLICGIFPLIFYYFVIYMTWNTVYPNIHVCNKTNIISSSYRHFWRNPWFYYQKDIIISIMIIHFGYIIPCVTCCFSSNFVLIRYTFNFSL